jgi:quercetin dioxygenase-like cupin family protein
MTQLQHFRRLAVGLDTDAAFAEIERHPQLWSLIQLRQKYAGSAHRDSETIVLRGPTTTEGLFDNLDAVDYPYFRDLSSVTRLLTAALEPLRWQQLGRVMVVRLKSGGVVTPHTDEGLYARYFARFHLVLKSSPACTFTAGGESVHMAQGELWWFNHQVEHSVTNGRTERTHIIVDLCAPGFTGALARPA